MQGSLIGGGVLAVLLLILDFFGLDKGAGWLYCNVRHPVEMVSSPLSTCEEQHVIQRAAGGEDKENIIWINRLEHNYADRALERPWTTVSFDWLFFEGNGHLKQAYKMGVYANGYHFMLYDYGKSEGQATLVEWDGASHLVYAVASVANFITKELSYLGYQFETGDGYRAEKRKTPTQWTDALLGVPIDFAELYVGVGYSALGVVVGLILQPIDTITNLPGMVVFIVKSILVGLWNTVADIISIFTGGYVQWQTSNW